MNWGWGDEEDQAMGNEHEHVCCSCGKTFTCCEDDCGSLVECPACATSFRATCEERHEQERLESLSIRLGCTASDKLPDVVVRAAQAWEEGVNQVTVEVSSSFHHPLSVLHAVHETSTNWTIGEFLAAVRRAWDRAIKDDLRRWEMSRRA